MFVECIESGVVSSKKSRHGAKVIAEFANGWEVEYWSENKMYAYAKDCKFTNKGTGSLGQFKSNAQPEMWCAYMILDLVENHA